MSQTQIGVDAPAVLKLDARELKLLRMCLEYGQDPFGAPNHLLMLLVSKLFRVWKQIETVDDLHAELWIIEKALKRLEDANAT